MIRTGRIGLHQHELIGRPITVVGSSNRSQIGIRGVVTDETRGTLSVATEAGTRMIGKRGTCFAFHQGNGTTVTIEGAKILARPHERVTGRIRRRNE